MLHTILVFLIGSYFLLYLSLILCRLFFRRLRNINGKRKFKKDEVIVGFFHPYCNSGGGGERVLWTFIKAVQEDYPNARCVVYTGDTTVSAEGILNLVLVSILINNARFKKKSRGPLYIVVVMTIVNVYLLQSPASI
jgi:hypothetical protein